MPAGPLSGPDVLAVVRIHADRLHDAVRRLGCAPTQAVEVVGTASLDLVEAVRARSDTVGDPVGWLFTRARELARSLTGSADDELPKGGGILGTDDNQVRLAEALEALPERQRAALLLRDSYDLPASAVGTALGLDADGASEFVGTARLAFLPRLLRTDGPRVDGHPVELGALARLGESRAAAARDATTRRHAQSCDTCSSVLDAQERARRLLSGLTVVAMPDADREQLLQRVESRARKLLPTPAAVQQTDEQDLEDATARRLVPISLIALGLLLALAAGAVGGAYASRDRTATRTAAGSGAPLVTAAPVLTLSPVARTAVSPAPSTAPRVFLITPSPTPVVSTAPPSTATPTPAPTVTPSAVTEPLSLVLTPATGPNGGTIRVDGRGWQPGAVTNLVYRDATGRDTDSHASALVDASGRFTTTLVTRDPIALPGRHMVEAMDGTSAASADFRQTR